MSLRSMRATLAENSPQGGGFGFLPLHMMQKYNLIEKYAEEAGLRLLPSRGG
jgi:hypothetical protein